MAQFPLPLVSIVYVTYRHERFALDALNGVLTQTYPLLDIIILDDASPDSTAQVIADELARCPDRADIRFVRNEENLGAFGNTRKGLSLAQGDFIILFNGDDVMLPTMVEHMVKVWREYDVSLVTGNARYINESGAELNRFFCDPVGPYDETFETLARQCGNAVCFGASMGFERSLYAEFGYPPDYLAAEDVILPFWAYLAKGVRFIPEPLLKYRVHDQNTSMTLRYERSTDPIDRLQIWVEDRYIHLTHAFVMISELERLARSDPSRYAEVERRILPLLTALVYERAQQMADARRQLHDPGVPADRPRDADASAVIESATGPVKPMKLFTTIYDDARLLGHFLRHYDRAGVTDYFIATAPGFAQAVEPYTSRYKITVCDGLDVADSWLGGASAVSDMREAHQNDDEWVIIVDLDEFAEFSPSVMKILQLSDDEGANVVRGIMYDRFSADGRLIDFSPEAELCEVYPVRCRLIRDLMGGTDYKGVLVKGRLRPLPDSGHHGFVGERISSHSVEISHYKWNARAIDRVLAAYEALTKAGKPWAFEYERVIAHYEQHGRFAWEEFGGELAEH